MAPPLLSARLNNSLTRVKAIKYQVYFLVCVQNIAELICATCERTSFHQFGGIDGVLQQDESSNTGTGTGTDSPTDGRAADTCLDQGRRREWSNFAKLSRLFHLWRCLTAGWMLYVLAKFAAIELYGRQLDQLLALGRPLHCFLPGRFIIHESFAGLTGLLIAVFLLSWQLRLRLFQRPFKLAGIYFLLMDEQELRSVYARLQSPARMAGKLEAAAGRAARPPAGVSVGVHEAPHNGAPRLELTTGEASRLSARELFVLDIMCLRLERRLGVLYILRPGRTLEDHLKLRRHVALLFLTSASFMLCSTIALALHILLQVALDARYLRAYPGCDPHLQRLNDTRQLAHWSMTPTWNHLLTGATDVVENTVLWLEGGLVCTFGFSLTNALNYDLILHWRAIDQHIRWAHEQCRAAPRRVGPQPQPRPPPAVGAAPFAFESQNATLCELQAEIMDFFRQLKRVDLLVSDVLVITLVGWLIVAASYTYYTKVKAIELPHTVILLLAFIVLLITLVCFSFLALHRRCRASFNSLCSLMAVDQTQSHRTFGLIVDLYVRKRTCYTLFQQYPFQPTTFLSIVGYSFSCFFLIAGLFSAHPSGGERVAPL